MGYNLFWQIIVLINSAQLLYCAIEDEGIDVSHVKQMIAKNANYLESIILEPAIVYSISLFVFFSIFDHLLSFMGDITNNKRTFEENFSVVLQKVVKFLILDGIINQFIGMSNARNNPLLRTGRAWDKETEDQDKMEKRKERILDNLEVFVNIGLEKYKNL